MSAIFDPLQVELERCVRHDHAMRATLYAWAVYEEFTLNPTVITVYEVVQDADDGDDGDVFADVS